MTAESQPVALLPGEIANLMAGTFFLFICLTSLSVAAIRRVKKGARILLWLGVWSGMYGAQELLRTASLAARLPISLRGIREFLLVGFSYLIIVAATLTFLELTQGALHRLLQANLVAGLALAVAALTLFTLSRPQASLRTFNQFLTIVLLAALVVTLSIPNLSRRFLVVGPRRVLAVGTFIFAAQALWVNIARTLSINWPDIYNTLGFAIFLLSTAYTGIEIMITDERRLLSLEDELAIARQLQFSILPEHSPHIAGLDIAAVYKPMSAVAGDFYEFLVHDERHVGLLIADVSGHGVPAALVASMIKVASQAVNGCPSDPAQVLHSIGSILNKNVRGQLVSAAYLWMDMAAGTAAYSAAGHPALLRWRKKDGTFTSIESNGLLFGVNDESEYPVCNFPLSRGDRFLLYTDGLTEPENQSGQPFGERKLEHVMRDNQARNVSDLSALLPAEIRAWQPSGVAQQDDITLILVDVLDNRNELPAA